jgi:hypothetical protein
MEIISVSIPLLHLPETNLVQLKIVGHKNHLVWGAPGYPDREEPQRL